MVTKIDSDEIEITCAGCGKTEIVDKYEDLPNSWIILISTIEGELEEVSRYPSWLYHDPRNLYCCVECYENQ